MNKNNTVVRRHPRSKYKTIFNTFLQTLKNVNRVFMFKYPNEQELTSLDCNNQSACNACNSLNLLGL